MRRILFSRLISLLRPKNQSVFHSLKYFLFIRALPVPTKIGALLGLPVVIASTLQSKSKDGAKSIIISDQFFDSGKYKDSYDVLAVYKDTDDDEILWRLSRGLYNMTIEANVSSSEVTRLIQEADSYITRAIAINENNYAVQKWSAIILNARTTQEGVKSKINSLPTFKHHIMRAIELNPRDPTSLHMLGTYFYNIADLPWYQKKIASTLFGKVPDASFQEALIYFNKAEETSPNFYSLNLLMLGKTYMKLDMIDSAKHWLQRAANSDAKTDEDNAIRKEATDLLKGMKK